MSQIEENQATSKSGSTSTVVARLAAFGSVIAASSCCLPLLPFLFAAGAAGTSAFVAQLRPYLYDSDFPARLALLPVCPYAPLS